MGGRRAERTSRRGRRRVAWFALFATLVTVGVVAPALVPTRPEGPGPSPPAPSRARTPVPSPTIPADVSDLPIEREPFCSRIHNGPVASALEGQVEARTSYRPEDRVSLAPGVTDVVHEFGCTFRVGDAEAQVWVFAAPVDTDEARQLVADVRGQEGCRYPDDALGYGTPSLIDVCELGASRVQVTARGLFDDSWLSCRLTAPGPADQVLRQAERFCLHVAATLGARP